MIIALIKIIESQGFTYSHSQLVDKAILYKFKNPIFQFY